MYEWLGDSLMRDNGHEYGGTSVDVHGRFSCLAGER
jgi:hypothetical protein